MSFWAGGYNSITTFAGIDSCNFTCNTNHFLQTNGAPPPINNCVACNQNPATCATGQYLDLVGCTEGAFTDSQCVSCTNKPSDSTYTGYGTTDGNNCPWLCDLGFYSNQTHCIPCSTPACEPGFYRDQCDRGTDLVAGTNSDCSERCSSPNPDTGIGPAQVSFTWTSSGTYDSGLFRGNNDCTMLCNFNGGTGYYTQTVTTCIKITARDGTCGTGFYTLTGTTSTDSSCTACTNYPYNRENMSFAGEQNRFQSGINATVNTVFRYAIHVPHAFCDMHVFRDMHAFPVYHDNHATSTVYTVFRYAIHVNHTLCDMHVFRDMHAFPVSIMPITPHTHPFSQVVVCRLRERSIWPVGIDM